MKTKILFTALLLTFLTSCSIFQTKEKRAQNHLGKAISLDPSIIKSSEKDSTRIKDSVVYKDSIRIKDSINVVTKDSTIIIPPSDLNGIIENPCDTIKGLKPFNYNLGSGVHKLHIWSDGKTIRYTSTVDQLVSTIRSKDTYIEHLEDSLHSAVLSHEKEVAELKKEVVTIIKYQPTLFQSLIRIIGGLVVGAGLMFLYKKFF